MAQARAYKKQTQNKTTFSPKEEGIHEVTRSLIQRLSMGPNIRAPRIIAFISARPGEGTSTIAREYATTLAAETNQKVLLIDAGQGRYIESHGREHTIGIVDAMVAGHMPSDAIPSKERGLSVARWLGQDVNRSMMMQVTHNNEFWKSLLGAFNVLVVDAPSLQSSYDGVVLAARADTVVLIVEAEKTPQPVIKNLRDTLAAAGAKISGIVMNKRRYHIPQKAYSRM